MTWNRWLLLTAWGTLSIASLCASDALCAEEPYQADAARGYQLLTEKAYLPSDFDQETFDELWKVWEEPLRSQADAASPEERRQLAFARYGLWPRPNDPENRPLQYVVSKSGNWTMNCFACHGGQVAGKVVPGLPNTNYALETLTADVRLTKIRLGKKLTHMDVGSLVMPLGSSNGTTNAVMFGVVLLNYRDESLNIVRDRPKPKVKHHDHDAPPWWNVKYKERLYSDDFAPRSHRALMQFLLVEQNKLAQFEGWENDYRDIAAYIESLSPPKYPFEIDQTLAETGRAVFERTCAECHGTYGEDAKYPERIVPIEKVGTDPVRWQGLTEAHRDRYAKSWFAQASQEPTITKPAGYVAPPLHGIWASAPYFHNGAVPTLWHVLHPAERPKIWKRTLTGYDAKRVGLEVAEFPQLPTGVSSPAELHTYFDTNLRGKRADGHDFPAQLSEEELQSLLEYLKTL
jgi:mono/diheme cytochrome c family protein